jgi:hypothetical protein
MTTTRHIAIAIVALAGYSADITKAGTPRNVPDDDASPPLLTHALEHGPDQRPAIWHFHAVSLKSENSLHANW